MRVAVTRAEPGAQRTARALAALGHDPVVAPLLDIVDVDAPTDFPGVQALLFTSANAVRARAAAAAPRTLAAWCVGAATADAARAAGFEAVRSADGDVAALAAQAAAQLDAAAGALVHLSGAEVAGDLVGALRARGFDAQQRIVYRAEPVRAPPPALTEALPQLDAVLFHSPRAAQVFRSLYPDAGAISASAAVCLSAAVADAAGPGWRATLVAATPDEPALLAALARAAR
ncbi:MAG: uroporphyrinogen-III synthase [Hyphomonadaceae bacterium]|nr:uroporphyrinogen-III synthase [Hyphomonadaceae bacterium]